MKSVNFGLIYGMGPKTLWKRLLNQKQKQTITFEDALNIYKTWKARTPCYVSRTVSPVLFNVFC